MLCSISTQKSGSSKWLDRLRSSKGFPSSDFVNLEQFLNHDRSSLLDSPPITLTDHGSVDIGSKCCSIAAGSEKEQVLKGSVNEGGKELFNAFSHVLAELFNMGGPSNCVAHKRDSRKQSNPRLFSASTSSGCNNSGPEDERSKEKKSSPIRNNLSRTEMKKVKDKVKLLEQGKNLVTSEVEENIFSTLSGFSRSEVTVIDTSCAPWKFDKLVFRQKNVWKVRDKRTKTACLGKNKRDGSAGDGNVGRTKKQKVSSGDEIKLLKIEGLQPHDKFKDAHRKTSDTVSSLLENKSRDFALKKAKSSVVLIQNIPSKKSAI